MPYLVSIKLIWFCLLTLLVLWITAGGPYLTELLGMSDYNAKRILQSFFLVFLPLVIISSTVTIPKKLIFSTTTLLLIICGAISAYLSSESVMSFSGYWLFISLFFTVSYFSSIEINNNYLLVIATLVAASIFLYVVAFYIPLIIDYSQGILRRNSVFIYHGFDSPRFLNQVQTWCLPFLFITDTYIKRTALLSTAAKKVIRILLIFTAASYVAIIFITGGRGTILAYFLTIPFLWILLGKRFYILGTKIVLIWVAGFLLYYTLINLIPQSLEINLTTSNPGISISRISDSGRIPLFMMAVESIIDHPLFGAGPLMYSVVSNASNHPHNSVLWLMSEWGLLATIPFIGLISYLLFCYFQRIKTAGKLANNDPKLTDKLLISHALFVSLVAALIHSLVSGVYLMPGSQMVGLFVIILSFSNYHQLGKTINIQNDVVCTRTLPLRVKSMTAIALLLLLVPTYFYYKSYAWGQDSSHGFTHPAYWLQGDLKNYYFN
jgi:hypothetical protein